jgi:hypothetical protein
LTSKDSRTAKTSFWPNESATGFSSYLKNVRTTLTKNTQHIQIALRWPRRPWVSVSQDSTNLDQLSIHFKEQLSVPFNKRNAIPPAAYYDSLDSSFSRKAENGMLCFVDPCC